MEHQTNKPGRIQKTITNCIKESIAKLVSVPERLNSPIEFHEKNDESRKYLHKLTIYCFFKTIL